MYTRLLGFSCTRPFCEFCEPLIPVTRHFRKICTECHTFTEGTGTPLWKCPVVGKGFCTIFVPYVSDRFCEFCKTFIPVPDVLYVLQVIIPYRTHSHSKERHLGNSCHYSTRLVRRRLGDPPSIVWAFKAGFGVIFTGEEARENPSPRIAEGRWRRK